ncbi:MAG: bifunctional nuclease family protein [Bacteroidales bacterium]|nr:bifunctional nuclease family protein [Bacteroidales bacterium]
MNKILLDVIGLSFSHSQSGAYALLLGEKNDERRLPVIIGESEAQSIAIAMENIEKKRPLTHDLFKTFATSFDIKITEVVINRFKEGLFFSELHCEKDGEETIIDARTSDAVAIAIRFKCPIYTTTQVMEDASIVFNEDELENEDDTEEPLKDFGYERMDRYSLQDLQELLQDAIDNEDYTAASILRDEINKRKEK